LTRHGKPGRGAAGEASDPPAAHPVTGVTFDSPVPPGTGWPDDPAGTDTRVASSAADVERLAADADLPRLDARVSVCRACPGLVRWRETAARDKRRAFAGQPYWGRPVPGWGPSDARVLLFGLAPAAHGGNRTGRIFTGDRSGDWLFAALHRVGLAAQPTSEHAGDGQRLLGTRVVAAVRCAPPDNKPSTAERDTCAPWLHRELELLAPTLRSVVCLGSYAWAAALRGFRSLGYAVPRPQPRFGHAAEAVLDAPSSGDGLLLLGCYHPSQQNTFTGKLTEPMLDAVLTRARDA
jgi:uracil-DNA glycosylase